LVNITAGPDLSLGEYAEVGSIIEAFASDEAMVKVGTVIDPDMRDELHVTVVATGLDPRMEKPVKVVDNTNTLKVAAAMPAMTVALDEGKEVNYNHYDRPAMQRRASGGAATASKPSNQEEMDYLDIPAFLRRQAD
jgi:cell division protein FtsZ